MNVYVELFLSFAKIGILTFGGGLAMLPMLKYELVYKREWVTEDEILNYYAVGQCTPGVIAVNVATFIGHKKAGIVGGIIGTLGMITPSVILITILATILTNIMDQPIVASALVGIRGVVCALLINTVYILAKASIEDIWCGIIFVIVILAGFFLQLPSVAIVIISGILGVLIQKFLKKGEINR
ncbi:MAG: chromate transporter [Clostridiales bacterium]|nr:chromate transporter [Clostridiales bacterium]